MAKSSRTAPPNSEVEAKKAITGRTGIAPGSKQVKTTAKAANQKGEAASAKRSSKQS